MHPIFEILSELFSVWPATSGKQKERKPVRNRRKVSRLDYKPLCKITTDPKRNDVPHKDESN